MGKGSESLRSLPKLSASLPLKTFGCGSFRPRGIAWGHDGRLGVRGGRRDPKHERTWLVLVDGQEAQQREVEMAIARLRHTLGERQRRGCGDAP